ncbi:hypothetical protein ADL27_62805 [Streptomyces sp. NRRL F-6602]|nr:hypothetical protein ADL27_62805 [Streptomyces sp. NRRL F-6602]
MFYVLAAILGGAFGIAWAAITGDRSIPWPAVIGFALAAGFASDLLEKAVLRRRARRARGGDRRTHARKAT